MIDPIFDSLKTMPLEDIPEDCILSRATCGPGASRWGIPWSESEREAHKDNPFFTKESQIAAGKKGGRTTKDNNKGIFDPDYDRTPAAIRAGKLSTGGEVVRDTNRGLFDPKNKHKVLEGSRKARAQKWKCLVTGYISNSCGLSNYQKGRGINYKDKSLRVKVSNLEMSPVV